MISHPRQANSTPGSSSIPDINKKATQSVLSTSFSAAPSNPINVIEFKRRSSTRSLLQCTRHIRRSSLRESTSSFFQIDLSFTDCIFLCAVVSIKKASGEEATTTNLTPYGTTSHTSPYSIPNGAYTTRAQRRKTPSRYGKKCWTGTRRRAKSLIR
jgi:hypothetical protein